jgi:predicted  nucleic acid-binding Zn-ribbon protein
MDKQCVFCEEIFPALKEIRTPKSLIKCCDNCASRYYKTRILKSKYGITLKQKEKALANQGFKCALNGEVIDISAFQDCNRAFKKGDPGFVRGLLCETCGKKLLRYENHRAKLNKKWFKNNKDFIRKADDYLSSYTTADAIYNDLIREIEKSSTI